jgi:hypothetical protein
MVLTGVPILDGEGPVFDGLRLQITDFPEAVENEELTGWTTGDADSKVTISAPTTRLDGEEVKLVATAADYRITITEEVADTSFAGFGVSAIPMRFRVENTTAGEPRSVLFEDYNDDGLPNSRRGNADRIYILEDDGTGTLVPAWRLDFANQSSLPEAGDVFTFVTLKPITSEDVYEFIGAIGVAVEDDGEIPDLVRLDQNYPNPFAATTTIPYRLEETAEIRLTLHDILGRQLAILKSGWHSAGDHRVDLNASNMPSGVYFYQLETGGATVRKSMMLVK